MPTMTDMPVITMYVETAYLGPSEPSRLRPGWRFQEFGDGSYEIWFDPDFDENADHDGCAPLVRKFIQDRTESGVELERDHLDPFDLGEDYGRF